MGRAKNKNRQRKPAVNKKLLAKFALVISVINGLLELYLHLSGK